jgi:hypothetical protein
MHLPDDALDYKQLELGMQKNTLAITQTHGFDQSILHEIVELKMTPTLKNEFDYKAKHVMY